MPHPDQVPRSTKPVTGAPAFIPGGRLCGAFYTEVVRPLLQGRPHAAALLGWGSDVLGYDTVRSTDHGWGPRVLVFVEPGEDTEQLTVDLDQRFPERFRGWPVRFGWDTQQARAWVQVTTVSAWLVEHLGVDAAAGMSTLDWLLTPQQRLLGVVAGPVFADDGGRLAAVRAALAWYPDQVWRWLLACQWDRLAQEEAFVARTAEVGDDTGSAVAAARLARDVMRLAMLLERRYAPYQKWLGTAFGSGRHPDGLPRLLRDAVQAPDPPARESALAQALSALAVRHNRTGLTETLDPSTQSYYERPAQVLRADRFTQACLATVTDPALRALPLVGAVDQVVDSTAVLSDPRAYRRLAPLYQAVADGAPADPPDPCR